MFGHAVERSFGSDHLFKGLFPANHEVHIAAERVWTSVGNGDQTGDRRLVVQVYGAIDKRLSVAFDRLKRSVNPNDDIPSGRTFRHLSEFFERIILCGAAGDDDVNVCLFSSGG